MLSHAGSTVVQSSYQPKYYISPNSKKPKPRGDFGFLEMAIKCYSSNHFVALLCFGSRKLGGFRTFLENIHRVLHVMSSQIAEHRGTQQFERHTA